MFLKLTEIDRDRKIRVNTNDIVRYVPDDTGTNVFVSGGVLFVKETPEEIDRLLIESHIFIKEIS